MSSFSLLDRLAAGQGLLTAKETADILRISHGTLRNWMYRGTCPVNWTKVGGGVRFKVEELINYLYPNNNIEFSPMPQSELAPPAPAPRKRGRPRKALASKCEA